MCDLASTADGIGGLWIRLVQSSWKEREWSSSIICLGVNRPLPDRDRVYSTIAITITQKNYQVTKVRENEKSKGYRVRIFDAEI